MKRLKIAVEEAQREAEQRAVAAEQEAAALQVQLEAARSSLDGQLAASNELVATQALRMAEMEGMIAWLQQELEHMRDQNRREREASLRLQQEITLLKVAAGAC
ncbi:hypothetical protein ABPG77_010916 [Micractinium sp. CCAP 211/92]